MLLRLLGWLVWPLDRALALVAYPFVVAYQWWLSPRKGFRCAAGAVTGRSCSDVARDALRTGTLSRAVRLTRRQFAECRHTLRRAQAGLLEQANAHLAHVSALAAVGALGCCDFGPPPPPPPI